MTGLRLSARWRLSPRLRGGEKIAPILETLCFAGGTQIVVSKLTDGKFKATSKSWDESKVILPDRVIEVWLVDGRIHGLPARASPSPRP